MNNEQTKPKVKEIVTLHKFDGDDTTAEPVETIVIENGLIISHTYKGN
jgi:hypothetical protein